jgi:pimeloyl-ACP methyl ester carboxylesterase
MSETLAALANRTTRRRRTATELAITTPNGITEEHFLRIGGIDQWVQIRGEDRRNPVLLVLHGGPGSPYALFTPLIRSWERHFTVVQWDRRGVGRTRVRSGPAVPSQNTFDRLVADTVEVIEFLRGHLAKEKVVVFAGSMGTLIGVPLAKRRPDLLAALVCTDMYTDMHRNEAESYRMTVERVHAAGNAKAVRALERIGADPARWDLRAWQVKMDWTMKTDPVTPNLVNALLFPLALTSPIYTLGQLRHLLAGFIDTQKQMYKEYMAYDAYALGTDFDVPFVLIQGADDVLTVTDLATSYYTAVHAPTKAMTQLDNGSHFAAFTQPQACLDALLTHVWPLVCAGQPTR